MSAAGQNCAACRFAAEVVLAGAKQVALVCRRNPPIPIATMIQVPPSPANPNGAIGTNIVGFQPPVTPETWCAEWTAKPAGNGG